MLEKFWTWIRNLIFWYQIHYLCDLGKITELWASNSLSEMDNNPNCACLKDTQEEALYGKSSVQTACAGTYSYWLTKANCKPLIAWNHPWWDYLHRGNCQILQGAFFFPFLGETVYEHTIYSRMKMIITTVFIVVSSLMLSWPNVWLIDYIINHEFFGT